MRQSRCKSITNNWISSKILSLHSGKTSEPHLRMTSLIKRLFFGNEFSGHTCKIGRLILSGLSGLTLGKVEDLVNPSPLSPPLPSPLAEEGKVEVLRLGMVTVPLTPSGLPPDSSSQLLLAFRGLLSSLLGLGEALMSATAAASLMSLTFADVALLLLFIALLLFFK